MSKYSKSFVPIVAALGAVLADVGLIAADMVGDFTSSIVMLAVALGVYAIPNKD